jgi:AcrR family transcriptional regulator
MAATSPQPLPLRERKRLRTRRAIANAALAEFTRRGFAGVTVDQLCEIAEVSKSTFFRTFPSKEAAAIEAETEFWALFEAGLDALPEGEPLFQTLMERLVATLTALPPAWDADYVRTRRLVVTAPELLAYVAHLRNTVEGRIRARLAERLALDPAHLRLAICVGVLMTTWSFVARDWVMQHDGRDRAAFIDRLRRAAATTPQALSWAP